MTQTPGPADATTPPTRILLLYRGDGGVIPTILDVLKKAAGVEECPLCHATFGATGMKPAWRDCQRSLGIPVEGLHRNEVPRAWQIREEQLPCVLAERAGTRSVLLDRDAIAACEGSPERLDAAIREALARGRGAA